MNCIQWTKRHISKIVYLSVLLLIGSVIMGGGIFTSSVAYATGKAAVWTLDSNGDKVGDAKVYYTTDTELSAQSYHRQGDGTGRLLWVKVGKTNVWTLDVNGNKVGDAKVYYTTDVELTAVSYALLNDGTGRILFSKPGKTNVWTLDVNGDKVGNAKVYYTTDVELTATSYAINSDGTARILFSKSGKAAVWTLDVNGDKVGNAKVYYPTDVELLATSYMSSGTIGAFKMSTIESSEGASITVRKAGSGAGTISDGTQVCDMACTELVITYVNGEQVDVEVTPATGSVFAGWQTAEGVALENIYYANPGDTVYAIFNQ